MGVAYGVRQAKEAFELAKRVRQSRERRGSTQPGIARLEAGGITPSLATLRCIATALDLELVVELRTRRGAA